MATSASNLARVEIVPSTTLNSDKQPTKKSKKNHNIIYATNRDVGLMKLKDVFGDPPVQRYNNWYKYTITGFVAFRSFSKSNIEVPIVFSNVNLTLGFMYFLINLLLFLFGLCNMTKAKSRYRSDWNWKFYTLCFRELSSF